MSAPRLGLSVLEGIPAGIARPAYASERLGIGIVHLGIGAFHRAHRAPCTPTTRSRGNRATGASAASACARRMSATGWRRRTGCTRPSKKARLAFDAE